MAVRNFGCKPRSFANEICMDKTLRFWRRPLQSAVLTTIGLIAALLGTGASRILCWICLAVPLAAGLRYLFARMGVEKPDSSR